MQYVLGNMLNGGGINPDGLSLDLQFAADKTLTARRGPTPTFIRSSGNNGGTTYFGPLVDFDLLNEIPATGITNGRTLWFKSDGGNDITISYTGTRWRVIRAYDGIEDEYLAAPGSEWRPDQADWSSQEYTITTSSTFGIVKAANNEPRFDHDPTSPFACRGLLIEEGRTNTLTRSDDYNASEWNSAGTRNLTVTSNDAVSPSGSTDADKLTVGATTTTYQVVQTTATLTSGTAYTVSAFFKPNQVTRVSIWAGNPVTLPVDAMFDLTGAGSVVASAYGTASIQQYPNGWYRCIITGTAGTTASTTLRISPVSVTSRNYPGNSVDSFWAWGAQVEAGSFATSYIPTTTGTLARSADVCSIANTAPFWNSSEFTVFTNANFVTSGIDTYASNFNITSGFFGVRRNSSNVASAIIRSSGVNADINLGAFATGSMRTAVAHSTGQQAASLNGASAIQNNTAFVPSLNPLLNIGAGGVNVYLNGHVLAIRYYKKRLPNAKLAQLTA